MRVRVMRVRVKKVNKQLTGFVSHFHKERLTKPVKHRENTQKQLFDYFFIGWFGLFSLGGWAPGFGFETPTANPDVTLPSLIGNIALAFCRSSIYSFQQLLLHLSTASSPILHIQTNTNILAKSNNNRCQLQ